MNEYRKRVKKLEEIGRIRLSRNFWLREFLHSEIAAVHGITNKPDDLELAVAAGSRLCKELLEPLHQTFGSVRIRSGYRSWELNALGHRLGLGCASNEKNRAAHIWDRRDVEGRMGATACIVIPWFADYLEGGGDWRAMASWLYDHIPFASVTFFQRLGAFNLQWREEPERTVRSWRQPKGKLVLGDSLYPSSVRKAYSQFPPFCG
ncbi:hypothetical protein [Qipengyuania nanhaisediminis]|uniref:D-alanyl-D-alanine carboxypeptidase n=1 Tax=Qipengyuania nanhaisediminis TaxID=604088 RepID=A0A1I5LE90_9SPHN|nr:hypothetical protein [Qipengyuania nanhaisediminis]SFO95522.1 hypothetical protein SAMN04488060_0951 [Qipengyuania nanhaisediminis]